MKNAMHPPVQLCLSIIVLYAVAADPLLPVLKRPECGRNLEANIMGTRYDVHSGSDDGDFRSNSLWDRANSVDVGNVVSSDDDFDNLMRALPNETFLTVPDVIKYTGYPMEVHNVITSDGYILEMHRITRSPQRPDENQKKVPVLVMHGLSESSGGWVLMGKELGLGFILADAGYDVWLGNARGTRYSRRHVKYNPDGFFHKKKFWSFSWHEIGTIDLPAMIDYILQETSWDKLHYIGHSQGTTAFFVMGAELPAYNDKIRLMTALAPVALMGHVEGVLIRILAAMYPELKTAVKTFGVYEMTLSNEVLARMSDAICGQVAPETPLLCSSLLLLLDSFNSKQLNCSMIPVILGHTPAGSSIKQLMHYAQNVRSKRFQKYDYDSAIANYRVYGSWKPPLYRVENIRAPIVFFYAVKDMTTNHADVDDLARRLPNLKAKFVVQDPEFTHVDFIYAMNVRRMLYDKMVKIMKDSDRKANFLSEQLASA